MKEATDLAFLVQAGGFLLHATHHFHLVVEAEQFRLVDSVYCDLGFCHMRTPTSSMSR